MVEQVIRSIAVGMNVDPVKGRMSKADSYDLHCVDDPLLLLGIHRRTSGRIALC